MSYCDKCKIEVLDETEFCPLCHSGLKDSENSIQATGYPDILNRKRKIVFVSSILLFLMLVSAILGYYFNSVLKLSLGWIYVIPAGLLYSLMVLNGFIREIGYLKQIFSGTIGAVVLVYFIDWVTGFNRWSVNFVLPGALLAIDLLFIVLMMVNKRNYQGYMIYQLIVIVIALIPLILIWKGVVTHPLVSEIAFLSAIFVFLGTLIIGGRTAREEMKRRFHI